MAVTTLVVLAKAQTKGAHQTLANNLAAVKDPVGAQDNTRRRLKARETEMDHEDREVIKPPEALEVRIAETNLVSLQVLVSLSMPAVATAVHTIFASRTRTAPRILGQSGTNAKRND